MPDEVIPETVAPAAEPAAKKKRPRVPKGNRPWFLGEPQAERVLSMVLAVASEVGVLYDKLDTVARVAGQGKPFTLDDVERFPVSAEIEAEREAWRRGFLDRMFRILREEVENPNQAERMSAYESFVTTLKD
jgi:hypothetical protein